MRMGAVSKNIGKHNARFISDKMVATGMKWRLESSGSSGAGRKAAAEFSDDASQALD